MHFLGGLKYRNRYSSRNVDVDGFPHPDSTGDSSNTAGNTAINFRPSYMFARCVNSFSNDKHPLCFELTDSSRISQLVSQCDADPTRMETSHCQACKWEDSDIVTVVLCSGPPSRHEELCEYSYSHLCMGVFYQACIS